MPPRQPLESVFDDRGRQIGTVRKVFLGRSQREFWEARSLDGVDLGAHVKKIDAEWAIQDDNDAGRPRSRSQKGERYRPVYNANEGPIYLGKVGAPGASVTGRG